MVQTTGQFSGHCITNNDSGHPGFTRASRDAAALPKAAEVAQVLAAQEQSEEARVGGSRGGTGRVCWRFPCGGPLKEGFLRKHQPLNWTETLLVG